MAKLLAYCYNFIYFVHSAFLFTSHFDLSCRISCFSFFDTHVVVFMLLTLREIIGYDKSVAQNSSLQCRQCFESIREVLTTSSRMRYTSEGTL